MASLNGRYAAEYAGEMISKMISIGEVAKS